MSANTFYIAARMFSVSRSFRDVVRYMELTQDEMDDLAFFLCDKFGIEAVFPQKKRMPRLQVAA